MSPNCRHGGAVPSVSVCGSPPSAHAHKHTHMWAVPSRLLPAFWALACFSQQMMDGFSKDSSPQSLAPRAVSAGPPWTVC